MKDSKENYHASQKSVFYFLSAPCISIAYICGSRESQTALSCLSLEIRLGYTHIKYFAGRYRSQIKQRSKTPLHKLRAFLEANGDQSTGFFRH